MTVGAALRRILPVSLRRRISGFLIGRLNLHWRLPSRITIRVANYGDWDIYNEIFVAGAYDAALAEAIAASGGEPIHIVDLGANVGFFTLRAIDAVRQAGLSDDSVAITAVEADAICAGTFRDRVFGENRLDGIVRLVAGAVGQRTGMAALRTAPAHFPHNRVVADARAGDAPVPYVDLSELLAGTPRVDLLKCDVEGSEEAVLESYADVFRNVRVAVFELHRDLCDAGRCRVLMAQYGFTREVVIRPGEPHSTVMYAR